MSRDRRRRQSTLSSQGRIVCANSALAVILVALCSCVAPACGRKGPPLPPLVKLPVAPADLTAARRGETVDLQLTVPSTNTDSTRPANVTRVEVYAFTGQATVSEADVLRRGTRVASVAVKSPRDPEATTDPDDPEESEADIEPPEGEGLDQGARTRVQERLTAAARRASEADPNRSRSAQVADAAPAAPGTTLLEPAPGTPLLGPPPATSLARTYVGVGIAKNGRRGPVSRKVIVPLVEPPMTPGKPDVTYTETQVAVIWRPASSAAPVQEPAAGGVLAARLIGIVVPRLAYNVYEVNPPLAAAASARPNPGTDPDTPLTKTPISETRYADSRMTWGVSRCYVVRAAEIIDALVVESDGTSPTCVMLVDTFAPAAPKELKAVASVGAINLIWDANTEADLDGYLVLRGAAPGGALTPITPAPIRETSFSDSAQPGVRYVYAVRAVDKAGNLSPPSESAEETAR